MTTGRRWPANTFLDILPRGMDILFSSTMQLAAAIRAGQVSATEVLAAHLAQI